ncbi:hypothetical protein AAHH79_33420, partial [Burkholderia pseudomallei]
PPRANRIRRATPATGNLTHPFEYHPHANRKPQHHGARRLAPVTPNQHEQESYAAGNHAGSLSTTQPPNPRGGLADGAIDSRAVRATFSNTGAAVKI